ncbi:MAG: TetR family transcriptional regulator [Rhodoferax sp.]|uniref:TetR/AcrR family transcriptional regulator n=1 Tax=Rhodoferax sp. TaxID=50421 RepID=UPI0013FF062E|nr:TetR family transcriptional regulator [Rhodoferax sp.]NDP37930.1 TetR family transcriptional regulator [Rhodoferax sp.]
MQVTEKPTKQRTEVRQASLIEAALHLAAQRSPADITTGDLAQAVGISQGAVFRHFSSKEAIWLAVLDWVTDALMARLQAAATREPELAALQAVFMAHVDFIVEQPGVPRVVFQELQSPGDTAPKARVRALMQRYRQLLMQLLRRAQAKQAIAPEIDLQAAAALFMGSVQGLVMQALLSGDVPAMAQQARGVFAIFQGGLVAKAAH